MTSTTETSRNGRQHQILTFKKLGEAIIEGIDPPDELVSGLVYRQGIHSIYSPGGTGKTIIALWIALQTVKQGLDVIYVDEENGRHHVAELLEAYGAEPEMIDKHLHYAEYPGLTSQETLRWRKTVEAMQPSLAVFDSFADMLALEGLDENSSVHVTKWMKDFAEPVKQSGGAVLILDHINKVNSGKGARGSTAKLAAVDVAWKLDGKQFDRHTTAEITITKDKDRMGCLPKKQTFTIGGDGTGQLIFRQSGMSNEADTKKLTENQRYLLDILRDDFPEGAKAKQWQQATASKKMSESTFYRTLKELDNVHIRKDEDTGYYHLSSQHSHDNEASKPK